MNFKNIATCLILCCLNVKTLMGVGAVNINISSPGLTPEEIQKEELYQEMMRQKWFNDKQIREEYEEADLEDKIKIVLLKFYEEYKKYLAAKWWIDTKKNVSDAIIKPFVGVILTMQIMSFINRVNDSSTANAGASMAVGAMVGAQVQDAIPKIGSIISQFMQIYAKDFEVLPFFIHSPLSFLFSLQPKPQQCILQAFLCKAPDFNEKTRNYLIPHVIKITQVDVMKDEDVQAWKKSFGMISELPQASFKMPISIRSQEFKGIFKECFSTYNPKLQKLFLEIIQSYEMDSKLPSGPRKSPRIVHYCQGAPGVGKTHFTQQLIKALGNPPFFKIEGIGDGLNFYGEPIFPFNVLKASPLLQALHATSSGEKYRNVILYIDEFDKILKNKDYAEFFLKFFEGSTQYVPLHGVDIDISHLYIITAGNDPLTGNLEISTGDGTLMSQMVDHTQTKLAIRSRLKMIEFPSLGKSEKKQIVAQRIAKFLEEERLAASEDSSYVFVQREDLGDSENEKITKMIEDDQDAGARSILHKLDAFLREIKTQKEKKLLENLAQGMSFKEEKSEDLEKSLSDLIDQFSVTKESQISSDKQSPTKKRKRVSLPKEDASDRLSWIWPWSVFQKDKGDDTDKEARFMKKSK